MSYAALNIMDNGDEIMTAPAKQFSRPHPCDATLAAPLHILLVEDDDSDVMLTEIALDATHIDYELHTLKSGTDVLRYLRGQGEYCDEPTPELLLLDLSIPGQDGFEVLAAMAAKSERYYDLPIVILTGDTQCAFLKESYDLHIAAYLTKPCSPEKIKAALTTIRKDNTGTS